MVSSGFRINAVFPVIKYFTEDNKVPDVQVKLGAVRYAWEN